MEHQVNIAEAFVKPPGGYGRLFEAMYKGSMIGAGVAVFAVWPYVIANMRGHPEHGALVELNPQLLAFIFGGCEEELIQAAIERLCEPDPNSRTKKEEGRRLVRMGQFLYRVVNGAEYLAIRKDEANRQAHREAQARHREKKKRARVTIPDPVKMEARAPHRKEDSEEPAPGTVLTTRRSEPPEETGIEYPE